MAVNSQTMSKNAFIDGPFQDQILAYRLDLRRGHELGDDLSYVNEARRVAVPPPS